MEQNFEKTQEITLEGLHARVTRMEQALETLEDLLAQKQNQEQEQKQKQKQPKMVDLEVPWQSSNGTRVARTLKSNLSAAVRQAYKNARATDAPWVITLFPKDFQGVKELGVVLWPFEVLNMPRDMFDPAIFEKVGMLAPGSHGMVPNKKLQIWRVCVPQEPGYLAKTGGRRNPQEVILEGQLKKQGWNYTYDVYDSSVISPNTTTATTSTLDEKEKESKDGSSN